MAVFSLDKNYFFPVKIIKIVSHSDAQGILLLCIHKSWFHADALIKVETKMNMKQGTPNES